MFLKIYIFLKNFIANVLLVSLLLLIPLFIFFFFSMLYNDQYLREYDIIKYVDNSDDADIQPVLELLKKEIGDEEFKDLLNDLAYNGTEFTLKIALSTAKIHNYYDLYNSYDYRYNKLKSTISH